MNNASDDEHPGGIYLEARLAKKKFLFGRTFFSIFITNVFCAEMRVGHACICPRTDTWLAGLKLYPLKNSWLFRGCQKMQIPGGETAADVFVWFQVNEFRPK